LKRVLMNCMVATPASITQPVESISQFGLDVFDKRQMIAEKSSKHKGHYGHEGKR